MLKHVIPALTLCFLALPAWSQTEAAPTAPAETRAAAPEAVDEAPQTVLVSAAGRVPACGRYRKATT